MNTRFIENGKKFPFLSRNGNFQDNSNGPSEAKKSPRNILKKLIPPAKTETKGSGRSQSPPRTKGSIILFGTIIPAHILEPLTQQRGSRIIKLHPYQGREGSKQYSNPLSRRNTPPIFRRLNTSRDSSKDGIRRKVFSPREEKVVKEITRKKRKLNELLWEAAKIGNIIKIKELIIPEKGKEVIADINSTGIENRTALHCAVSESKKKAVEELLRLGASPDAKTIHCRTPLHLACLMGDLQMCETLLKNGAFINSQDYLGNSPVHYAAFYKKLPILKFLLDNKPDLTLRNKKGQTPIDITNNKPVINLFSIYLNKTTKTTLEATFRQKRPAIDPRLPQYDYNTTNFSSKNDSSHSSRKESPRLVPKPNNESYSSTGGMPAKLSLNNFEPIKAIGEGSFGKVFLVKAKSSGKMYALKALSKDTIIGKKLTKYAFTEKNVFLQNSKILYAITI